MILLSYVCFTCLANSTASPYLADFEKSRSWPTEVHWISPAIAFIVDSNLISMAIPAPTNDLRHIRRVANFILYYIPTFSRFEKYSGTTSNPARTAGPKWEDAQQ